MAVPVPVALFVHGKDAEIKQGATFTAFVDADTFSTTCELGLAGPTERHALRKERLSHFCVSTALN
jgi:hypothetical protein